MFVVRRKSDLKFWRNGGWCKARSAWTDDLQDVKPFRTIAAAKHSLMPRELFEEKHECCRKVKWRSRGGYTNKCEHFKAQQAKEEQQFKDTYLILAVKLFILPNVHTGY